MWEQIVFFLLNSLKRTFNLIFSFNRNVSENWMFSVNQHFGAKVISETNIFQKLLKIMSPCMIQLMNIYDPTKKILAWPRSTLTQKQRNTFRIVNTNRWQAQRDIWVLTHILAKVRFLSFCWVENYMFRTKPTRRLGSAGTHVYVLFTRFITLARTKSKLLRHYSFFMT